eukprot:TRINITY_DN7868_c0_g1_i1.p1 TRINITY_DN7868_c0_g1~~TRINITY_DN7868_c0_g1_i1.p1  ORF type:complete len:293 (-),score=57.64 TRINITY_DN7868_c0_g1_i1:9-887(-)
MEYGLAESVASFGSVGALKRIQNPIQLATKVLLEGRKGRLPLGRIRPIFLVGEGAEKWATNNGFSLIDNKELITEDSQKLWQDHTERVSQYAKQSQQTDQPTSKRRRIEAEDKDELLDTVGAICVDSDGNVAAGVSSGGISLKHPGRIGETAICGSGCWVEKSRITKSIAASSTSGAGEEVMKSLLASECAKALLESKEGSDLKLLVDDFFRDKFLLSSEEKRYGGLIGIKMDAGAPDDLDFVYGHTTESMGIGYMSALDKEPNVFISRMDAESASLAGNCSLTSGIRVRLC